ncbi:hypothetical protein BPOR_0448g00050 [Botrytis porri]|uniref:Uncharacterized protein n=1 Tax=Botrytis porri TaxID=87229 RepID=A0A4Z1KFX9_9HELO|nr:hypothetical protein BPOR_0448g00050 [Botrytis porri]
MSFYTIFSGIAKLESQPHQAHMVSTLSTNLLAGTTRDEDLKIWNGNYLTYGTFFTHEIKKRTQAR